MQGAGKGSIEGGFSEARGAGKEDGEEADRLETAGHIPSARNALKGYGIHSGEVSVHIQPPCHCRDGHLGPNYCGGTFPLSLVPLVTSQPIGNQASSPPPRPKPSPMPQRSSFK